MVIAPITGFVTIGVANAAANDTVSISEIQSNTDGEGASTYDGETVDTTGVVTAVAEDGYYVQETSGSAEYAGIFAYTGDGASVSVGDAVHITAPVTEFEGLTELDMTADGASVSVTGSATVPDPAAVTAAEAGSEAYESVLVSVSGVEVTSTPDEFGEWDVADGSGSVAVDNVDTGDDTTPGATGATIETLTGPVHYSFGQFKLRPKSVEGYTVPPTETFDVTNVRSDYYEVDGEEQPTLTLERGETYRFDVSAPGHPFHVSTDAEGGSDDGVYTEGVQVSNPSDANANAVEDGTLTFTVPESAPDTLYYQCGVHAGMGAEIDVVDSAGTEVTIIGYNDIGKAAAGSGSDPLGRMITLVNERRAAADGPVFVAGGGDEISPHALRNYDGLEDGYEPPVTALNVLNPDAEVVQNHELDYDEDAATGDFSIFQEISSRSNYPWLLSNVVDSEDGSGLPGTQNYTVVERDGVRVGFFGVTDSAIDGKTDNVISRNGYEVRDPAAASREAVDTLRDEENVDVVVGLAPLGIPDTQDLAESVDGVDVMISGDDQQRYPPQETAGTLITETTGSAGSIAEMTLTLQDGEVTDASGELIDVTEDVERNGTWQDYINPLREEFLNSAVVEAVMPENRGVGSSYTDDTATGNLLTDGVREWADADVAVTNAGGIRDTLYPEDVSAGERFQITRGMVTSTLSFGNQVVVFDVTGEELRRILKSQITTLGGDSEFGTQTQEQVSGVTFEWVPHNESAPSPRYEGFARIQDLSVNGEPVQPDETYTLATNSYIADGGSSYPMNISDSSSPFYQPEATVYETTMAQAVLATLENRTLIEAGEVDTELQDRMRRVDRTVPESDVSTRTEGDDVIVTFSAPSQVESVDGRVALSDRSGSTYVSDNADYDASAGEVTVRIPTDQAREFAGDDGLDLYVDYTDGEYSSQYENFDSAVLNADVGSLPVEGGTADGLSLSAEANGDDGTVPLAENGTVTVSASGATDGVGAYELRVSVGNADVARITDVSFPNEPGFSDVEIADDGSSATVDVALADRPVEGDLLTVSVRGIALDSPTSVEVEPLAGPYDGDGNAYAVGGIDNTQVSVAPGDVTGNGLVMADPDGDGVYEDVNGDGSVDIVDAQALFVDRETDPTQGSVSAFDFNGDGLVDVGDVQRLFTLTDA